jgi:hypothetical protein
VFEGRTRNIDASVSSNEVTGARRAMLGYAPQARMASAIREEIHDLHAAEAPRSGEADAAASALNVAAPLNVMT